MDAATKDYIDAKFAELTGLIQSVAGNSRPAIQATYTSTEVMTMLGYKCRTSFWIAVRTARIPYTRVSSRRIIFNADAVKAWMTSKTRNPVSIS